MKKLMATLFVLTFAMSSLVGCGQKEEAPADDAVKVEEPAAEPASDDKDKMESDKAEAPADSGDMEKMEKEEAK